MEGINRYKTIALVTDDFPVYHSIIEEARERQLNILVLNPEERIPPHVGVIITTEKEAEE